MLASIAEHTEQDEKLPQSYIFIKFSVFSYNVVVCKLIKEIELNHCKNCCEILIKLSRKFSLVLLV